MDRASIIQEMQDQNPWWGAEWTSDRKWIERDLLKTLQDGLGDRWITGLIGLRRVGKTTLMKIMIGNLLKEVDPLSILYFPFDLKRPDLLEVLKIYEEEILKRPMNRWEGRIFLFLDEVQNIDDWSAMVKRIYDKLDNIKFIVSGSSSLNMTIGAGESLAGRISFSKLEPFSFSEYLRKNGIKPDRLDLEDIAMPDDMREYEVAFNEYLAIGGMPGVYDRGGKEILADMLDITFLRDIVSIFPVKRVDTLRNIFSFICENSGQRLNLSNLSRAFNTQFRTVRDYLMYLEESFLVVSSDPLAAGVKKRARSNSKYYVSDHSFFSIWQCKEGLRAETIAFNHIKKMERPFYQQGPEVDMILPGRKWAFEIKYSDNISYKDAGPLLTLHKEYELFLVTRRTYDRWIIDDRAVNVIPLWMLCLSFQDGIGKWSPF